MCGLVGGAGNLWQGDKRMVQMLLELDIVRGKDSTGLALIEKFGKGKLHLVKSVGRPIDLFREWTTFDDQLDIIPSVRLALGHNRWATIGEVNENNAHPFLQGNIVGAHNGTLVNVKHLEDGESFEVDSEAIFYNLNKNGIDATIPRIHGAYALTWYDTEAEKLYFIRNSQRPLFYASNQPNDVLFWASEPWMLEIAAMKNKIKLDKITELKENTLYSLDLCDVDHKWKVNLKIEKEIQGYKPPVVKTTYTNVVGIGGGINTNPFLASRSNPGKNQSGHGASKAGSTKSRKGNTPSNYFEASGLPLVEIEKLIGTTVEFWVEDHCVSDVGLPYLQCKTIEDYEIRIYANGTNLWDSLNNVTCCWQAKIKRAVEFIQGGVQHRYATLEFNTIEQMKNTIVETSPEPTMIEGYNGAKLTVEEFEEIARNGCSWCTADVFVEDAPRVGWVGKKECVCPDCATNDDLKPFLGMSAIIN